MNYNVTVLRSESWVVDANHLADAENYVVVTFTKEKINGMPELYANVILGYDIDGFSMRISYFYQDKYPFLNNPAIFDVIGNKYSRLDIVAIQRLLENISVLLSVNNITNINEETLLRNSASQYNPAGQWRPIQSYRYGMNIGFGVRVEL